MHIYFTLKAQQIMIIHNTNSSKCHTKSEICDVGALDKFHFNLTFSCHKFQKLQLVFRIRLTGKFK